MTKDEFIGFCAEYAAGSLEGDDFRRFEEYLRSADQEDLKVLSEMLAVASMLPLALERQSPAPRIKEQLMQRIQVSGRAAASVRERTEGLAGKYAPPVPGIRRSWLPFGVTFVALAMILGFSLYMVRLMGTIDRQDQQLVEVGKEKTELATQIVALKDELSRKEELLKVLSSRQIEITIMNGLDVNPVGYGKILWDPERATAILQVANLPNIPSDKDYQLWVIKDKPISAGVFAVSGKNDDFFKIENLAVTNPKEISAFAITLEPKGGVPQPTGAMYMAGSPKKL